MANQARSKSATTVVVQARVSPAVAAKIKATAAVRGVPDAVIVRDWLNEMAEKTTTKSLAEELEKELRVREEETRALLRKAEELIPH